MVGGDGVGFCVVGIFEWYVVELGGDFEGLFVFVEVIDGFVDDEWVDYWGDL